MYRLTPTTLTGIARLLALPVMLVAAGAALAAGSVVGSDDPSNATGGPPAVQDQPRNGPAAVSAQRRPSATLGKPTQGDAHPQDDVRVQLRGQLEASAPLMLAADVAGVTGRAAQAVRRLFADGQIAAFYAAREYALLWGDDTIAELLGAMTGARAHGLAPANCFSDVLASLVHGPGNAVDRELLATAAFLCHAEERANGRLDPATVDPEWFLTAADVDAMALLAQKAAGLPADYLLDGLWPAETGYWNLVAARRAMLEEHHDPGLQAAAIAQAMPIGAGQTLRPGRCNPGVPELRRRMGLPAGSDNCFDAALEQAVRAFQQSEGLEVDGIVGPLTRTLLNLTDADRLAIIDVNLERWRWLPRTLPSTRIEVDVAAYRLRVIESGQTTLAMNVIVGTPFRRTPVFGATLRYLVFNPYWNVPWRIAVRDKLPQLQSDPASLAEKGFEVRRRVDAPVQAVTDIDWLTVRPATFDYLLRQRPGPDNALGRVKFVLPNAHAVFLHDTPARELFNRSTRAFSSGCIRLAEAMRLAEWALRDQPAWTTERIDTILAGTEPVDVPLLQPVPVMLLYFTAASRSEGLSDETEQQSAASVPGGTPGETLAGPPAEASEERSVNASDTVQPAIRALIRPDLYDRDAPVRAALEAADGVIDQGFAAL